MPSDDVNELLEKGKAIYQLGKFDEAITWFDKALESSPNHLSSLKNKGTTLIHLDRYDEAITSFDKYLEYLPNDNYVIKRKREAEEKLKQ